MNALRTNPRHALDVSPRRPRVLVADDDPELRTLLALALTNAGFDVVQARNGSDVLDRFVTAWVDPTPPEPIDLIVSDQRMPMLEGLAVVAALRNIDYATPVVLITAFADPATRIEALRLGVTLLDKPFDLDLLVTVIRSLLPPS